MERVLGVLDGAVLVVSAVEGVQAQTRVLLRTLRRLRIPTLLFVNKTDRPGARYGSLLTSITERLSPDIVAMGSTRHLGTWSASTTPFTGSDPGFTGALTDLLTRHDDELLPVYVALPETVTRAKLSVPLAASV
ncbi:TetM/TetW/TetO/TetS family tetracycline resistance ribosomal protection protein OS=Streptomyces cyaneofuscatus OX=66883 GN=G3I52_00540 PE=4 SV=1 [Streptomyces cyaneofuscatus]